MNAEPCVFIVDDDGAVRKSLALVVENAGLACQAFESAEDYLQSIQSDRPGCLLLDVNLPGLNGYELQDELNQRNIHIPIIFLSAYGDIPMTVKAIKAGATDFLTKPVPSKLLIERIQGALEDDNRLSKKIKDEKVFRNLIDRLTFREKEILPLAIAGISNKEIAQKLGISYRTVETHRIRILRKTGTINFLELARLCEDHNFALTKIS